MAACHWRAQTASGSQKQAPQQDEFAALMRNVEDMDRQRTARLSIAEVDALMRQIGRCWTLPVGIDGVEDMVVQLRIQVRPDRTVQAVTIEDQDRLGPGSRIRRGGTER
jgi:hypothetical protein